MREIKGLKFRESQFIKPEEAYSVSCDTEIQNKTNRELAIRIAPSKDHKTLGDSVGKMSSTFFGRVHVLQIFEDETTDTNERLERIKKRGFGILVYIVTDGTARWVWERSNEKDIYHLQRDALEAVMELGTQEMCWKLSKSSQAI